MALWQLGYDHDRHGYGRSVIGQMESDQRSVLGCPCCALCAPPDLYPFWHIPPPSHSFLITNSLTTPPQIETTHPHIAACCHDIILITGGKLNVTFLSSWAMAMSRLTMAMSKVMIAPLHGVTPWNQVRSRPCHMKVHYKNWVSHYQTITWHWHDNMSHVQTKS